MTNGIRLIVYPAGELDRTKALSRKFLDSDPYADTPYYVGYTLGDQEVGLDPNGEAVVGYVDVVDINDRLRALLDTGAVIHQDIRDVGAGLLIAQVKDVNGNVLGLRQFPK